MKILVLAGDVPATSNMPGSPRLFSLCRGLAARHSLTLVLLHRSDDRYEEFVADPTTAGVFDEVHVLPAEPPIDWRGRQVHRLRRDAHFLTRYRTPEFYREQCRRIRELYVGGQFDAIFADGLSVAQYVEGAAMQVPAVIDLHDCLTLLYERTAEREENWFRRMRLRSESRSLARCERALSSTFDAIITNSPVDDAFLKTLAPAANTLTIGNGVDTEFFSGADAGGEMAKLVFTGVMSYGPNEDAVSFFSESILPVVQTRYPEAQFWAVGKDPGPKLRARATAHVHVTGGVPDVRPFVQSAAVFVCPLRYGTGVKNKLLAALAMRKPVVATSRSLEGLELRPDQDLLVADEPAEFAEQVVRLLENPELARRLAASGQAFVRDRYSWESSARALEETLLAAARSGSRQTRAIGP
jgi:sugar transferase (PEP-CTERM/EpsH1 system associated)